MLNSVALIYDLCSQALAGDSDAVNSTLANLKPLEPNEDELNIVTEFLIQCIGVGDDNLDILKAIYNSLLVSAENDYILSVITMRELSKSGGDGKAFIEAELEKENIGTRPLIYFTNMLSFCIQSHNFAYISKIREKMGV